MNPITERVTNNLKLARAEANLTQQELADKMKCSKGRVTQWELGLREIKHEALLELGAALGKSWLWFYDHVPNQKQAETKPAIGFTAEHRKKWEDLSMRRAAGLADTKADEEFLDELKSLAATGKLSFCSPSDEASWQVNEALRVRASMKRPA